MITLMNKANKQTLTVAGFNANFIPDHAPLALLATEFLNLFHDQQSRLDHQQPISHIPLLFRALDVSVASGLATTGGGNFNVLTDAAQDKRFTVALPEQMEIPFDVQTEANHD